jgi:LPS-assembly protein
MFLENRKVKLNETDPSENSSSLLVGEAFWRLNQKWSIQSGLSWDSENNNHEKRNFAFSYRPEERKLLNMGYRSVRGSVDQTDLAFRYPVNQRINVVGRWNYDRLNGVTLDRYWGLEYDTCCWGVRAISRRYISDREGNSDNAFLLQLELKGLSSVGARADRLLQESIFTNGL